MQVDRATMTTAIPQVGIHRTEDHEYYWMGQGSLPGVTTAIKSFDKSNVLVGWAKRETARFALDHLDTLVDHRMHNRPVPECAPCQKAYKDFDGRAAAQRWISSLPDYLRDTAADLGTEIHAIAERLANEDDFAPPAEFERYANTYQKFLYEKQPKFLAVEYMGINLEHGYGGTGDIIAAINGMGTVAIDIKSWTKPEPIKNTYYPETGMQLAACSRFEFIGRENDPFEYKVPQVDSYAVLLLGPEEYRLIPYSVTDTTFDAFLACLQLHRWRTGEARTIVQPAFASAKDGGLGSAA
jgi:hypothetical protein